MHLVREAREHPALQAVLARHPEIMATYLPRLIPIVLEIAEPRLGPIIDAGAADGRWPQIDKRVAITWTTRLITSLIVMPSHEDRTESGLRAEVEALVDVTAVISGDQARPGD